LADGRYELPSLLNIQADGITLRGRSGDRHGVVLDGQGCRGGELVLIRGKRCTVADLTIQNVKWNGFKIAAELGAQEATIHNCVIHNVWQRGVKASHIPPDQPELDPRACRVQFCLFYNDRPKEFADDETDTAKNFNGNYIGGIDVKNSIGWTISDNVFIGLQGRTREGRGAIYISEEGRDCLIERNIIVDCDVGIALGNPSRGGDWLHAIGCTVRNNFVTRCPESGILACYTKDCRILHNTIHEPESPRRRLIWVQQENGGLVVANNLLSGPTVQVTSDSRIDLRDNVASEDYSDIFADAKSGDLHLKESAKSFPQVTERLAQAARDIDHDTRPDRPTAGADELAHGKWQPLFEGEAWYADQPGEESIFRGLLKAAPDADAPSVLQRVAYYRLGERSIYTGAKRIPELERLLDKQVELRGKAVEFELEGQAIREIWPAAVRATNRSKQSEEQE
jgi:hypothetical protein